MLRHANQDLIDKGLVDLGRPVLTIDPPLPTQDARDVPPPTSGIHSIKFTGDEISMMGWDGEAPQPINLYTNLDFNGYTSSHKIPRPFRFILDEVPRHTSISPVYLQHFPPMIPFILFPKEYGSIHKDVQIVTRSGKVAQPPPIDRPFAGTSSREDVQREDDEILRLLCTTQARISI